MSRFRHDRPPHPTHTGGTRMADLEALRDHARRMAAMTEPETEAADHEPGCWRWGRVRPSARCLCPMTRIVAEPPTDTERVIWRELADELEAGHSGTTKHCAQCASERLAGGDR